MGSSLHLIRRVHLPIRKVPLSNFCGAWESCFKIDGGEKEKKKKKKKSLNHCTESLALLRGLSLSSEEQTTHKTRWFPSAGFIQCTSSHRREPFCPPSTPLFQASTTGPFCSAAGNNLLLPSCSEVTFCPWLDSTRLYRRIAFELAVAFLCPLIRCQGEQCEALQNFSPAKAPCGMAGVGRDGVG